MNISLKIQSLFLLTLLFLVDFAYANQPDSIRFKSLAFVENKGQWNDKVFFKASVTDGNVWFENNSFLFDISKPADILAVAEFKHSAATNKKLKNNFPNEIRRHAFRLNFEGALESCRPMGLLKQAAYENYFLGNNSKQWASKVGMFKQIKYTQLYPGIDAVVYASDSKMKWDFNIAVGFDPSQIKISYSGVNDVKLVDGNLIIHTSVNDVSELKPYAYQVNALGNRIEVACQFQLVDGYVQFNFPNSYNKNLALTIDPVLVFASFSGSSIDNWGYTATYDSYGFLYAGGSVFGQGYPVTTGAYDALYNSNVDISISKFDSTGHFLIYSTYLGGNFGEVPSSLVVNSNDELFILGITGSSNFPMLSISYDTSFNGGTNTTLSGAIPYDNGSDLIITRFNQAGTQLLGTTYFGGSLNDGMNLNASLTYNYGDEIRGEIIIDNNDNCYIVSSTVSPNIPGSSSAFQSTFGGVQDGIIAKFDNSLSSLLWASYIGGSNADAIYSLALDNNQDLYITGGTISTNFPVSSAAFQPSYNGAIDGFISKISKNGNLLIKSTYFGTPSYDQSFCIDVDKKNNVYIFGQTGDNTQLLHKYTTWFMPNGGQFITKFPSSLDSILWSTIWGNSTAGPDISPSAFMVDLCNQIYCSGWGGESNNTGTTTGLPVTTSAFQMNTDGSDYYFLVINSDASALQYATFFGGPTSHEHVDGGTSRFDSKGRVYQAVCAGCGGHDDFPTTLSCYSSQNLSTNCNVGVIKFDFRIPIIIADFKIQPATGCAPFAVHMENKSYCIDSNLNVYNWSFGDGGTSTLKNPNHVYTSGGVFEVRLIVTNPGSCNLADTMIKQVTVLSNSLSNLPDKGVCPGGSTQIGLLPNYSPGVSYLWTPSTGLSNPTVSNPIANPLNTAVYTLLMSNGICTDTFRQKVTVYAIQVDAGNDTSICFATIKLTAHTGYQGLAYQWSSNSNFTDTLNSNLIDSSLVTTVSNNTMFYIKASFAYCSSIDSLMVNVRVKIGPGITQQPKCFSDTNGAIITSVTGGTLPYTYLWNTGATAPNLQNIVAGTYTVTVTDADNCFSAKTFIITQPDSLYSNPNRLNVPCAAACIGKAFANPIGGLPPYNWLWDDPLNQTTNPAVNLCKGLYNVVITDINNCKTYNSVTILDSATYINIVTTVSDDSIHEGQTVQINTTDLGTNYSYIWVPSVGLSNSTIPNPTATPSTTTTYIVSIQESNGCTWSDTIVIFVSDVFCEEPYIFVPNAFTPDNDGKNDVLFVHSTMAETLDFKIFDRWGEIVFSTNNISQGWNGSFKGNKSEPGVYVYQLEIQCYNKQKFIKSGNITLIR